MASMASVDFSVMYKLLSVPYIFYQDFAFCVSLGILRFPSGRVIEAQENSSSKLSDSLVQLLHSSFIECYLPDTGWIESTIFFCYLINFLRLR